MRAPKVVVYAGPTISPDEVRFVLPHAVVRAPAARGDLLAEDWRRGDVAVVIDGYFRERRSVGHKEILRVLSEGADVVGTASMGALRAMELAPCGMRGAGTVYGMYVSGEIDGDDEVGVLHGPADKGYPPLTVALVNLRYGCAQGAETELVPFDAGQRILAAAKALPFTFRTWSDIGRTLSEGDREALETLEEMTLSGVWDLKRLDATATLRAIANGEAVKSGSVPSRVPLIGISHTQSLTRQSRREYAPGRWMSDLDVLDAARLFDAGYPERHEYVLTALLDELARTDGMTVDAYVHARLGVDGGSALPDNLARWLTERELNSLAVAEQTRLVMARVWPVWQSFDWRPTVLTSLRESEHWGEWSDFVVRADEVAEERRYQLVVPPPTICAKLFLRHWQQRGSSPEVEMARRGFSSLEELGSAVRRFFAFDVGRRSHKGSVGQAAGRS
jgi:hypothetical protein